MVLGYLCISLADNSFRILHSCVFGDDTIDDDAQRYARKVNLRSVASRVQSEYSFRISCKLKEEYGTDDKGSGLIEKGYFKLFAGEPFPVDSIVVWLVSGQQCGHALVCLTDENNLLADNVLQVIAKATHDNILRDNSLAEILLKPERMAAIVHQFLPNGQLLFMNHKLVKQYEKQLDSILAAKH
ncbi:AP-5 complex subunit sigma-1-like isoform X2 [Dysidea avara]|uniref:AP-5 complex subunit sigma-1-like isoform X2 n=1 Tax=Dysidea avara TaxID=196820 RepID=UPI00332953F2